MKHFFDTERLVVFTTDRFVINNYFACTRQLVVAFPKDDSEVHTSMPVVTALLADHEYSDGEMAVDWLETSSLYRQHGFAKEVLIGLREQFPGLLAEGATEEGELLCKAVCCPQPEDNILLGGRE